MRGGGGEAVKDLPTRASTSASMIPLMMEVNGSLHPAWAFYRETGLPHDPWHIKVLLTFHIFFISFGK